MTCLPCEKEIIDNGMGIYAAQFFRDVVNGQRVLVAATDFYRNVVEHIFSPIAKARLEGAQSGSSGEGKGSKLSKADRTALMAQIDKQCYRADKLIAWGHAWVGSTPETHAQWVVEILGWAKDDQAFYTALATEEDKDKG